MRRKSTSEGGADDGVPLQQSINELEVNRVTLRNWITN